MSTNKILIDAVIGNDIEVIRKLSADKTYNKQIDCSGNTPLHLGVIQQNIDIVELLLDNNCELYAKNKDGFTALQLAEQTKNYDLIQKIRSAVFARALDRADNVSSAHINMNKESVTDQIKNE